MFDYANNQSYEIGGQSFAATVRSQYFLSDKTSISTIVQPSIFVLSAVISEYVDVIDRDYDFGSGLGFRFMGQYSRNNHDIFRLTYRGIFTHTLNGAIGNQIVHIFRMQFNIPVSQTVSLGVDYLLNARHSYYRDFENIHRRHPELRFGATIKFQKDEEASPPEVKF